MWPDDRERVVVGRLELFEPTTEAQIGDPVMMHDPTEVTDGIEVSPDDQKLAARRGAYLTSVAERTGGMMAAAVSRVRSPNWVISRTGGPVAHQPNTKEPLS